MPEDTLKVPAQEVLGTAWEKARKVRPVDEQELIIEVYFVNEDRTQEKLEPLEGKAEREDLAKLYGPGRYYLRARNRGNNAIISQSFCDIRPDEAPKHPMAVAAAVKTPVDLNLPEDDDRIGRLEQAIVELGDKMESRGAATGGTLMERVMEKLLLERLDPKPSPMSDPAVFGEMMKNILAAQSEAISQQMELRGEEKRYELQMRQAREMRAMEREDFAFQTKQRLLLEQAKGIQGEATLDPGGDNTMSLIEAIQDVIGLDKSMQIFGMNIADMISPVIPQMTKALQDRGIYILTKQQLETLLSHQFNQGKATGQQEALSGLEEGAHGPDGGSDVREPANDPGPDDQAAGGEGSAGEPDA